MADHDLLPFVLVGVSGATGALIAFPGLRVILRERASRRWPKAPGVVLSSSYEAADGTSRDAHGYDVTSTTFTPVVEYEYTVDGRTFRGRRIALRSLSTSSPDAVKRCIDRYRSGARVEVFYDPADPSSAFLETGASVGAVFLTAFGGLFLFLGLLGIALIVLLR